MDKFIWRMERERAAFSFINLSDDMVALLNQEQLDDDDSAIDSAKGHHR